MKGEMVVGFKWGVQRDANTGEGEAIFNTKDV